MMHMLHSLWPDDSVAITMDHQLRAESRDEAQHVAHLAQKIGLPHDIITPETPITGNVQSQARQWRYAALEQARQQYNCQYIATAHHADDQLETVMMRLARGAGLNGLCAIRPVNGVIIRPLLFAKKAELIAYCDAHALPYIHDPSNIEMRFDRVAMRNALQGFDQIEPDRLAMSMKALQDSSDALDWTVAQLAKSHIVLGRDGYILDEWHFPHEILRRLIIHILELIAPEKSHNNAKLNGFISTLHRGEQAMIGDILAIPGEKWLFKKAPPRRLSPQNHEE